MSGKTRVTKDIILDAALKIIRERGWESVSARSLAEALGSSTMPIYSAIGSMDELRIELLRRIESIIAEYQKRPYTQDTLTNMAIGYVVFAREQGRVFRFTFNALPGSAIDEKDIKKTADSNGVTESLKKMLSAWSGDQMQKLTFQMWVYVHGLACLAADGILELGDSELVRLIEEAGGAFYAALEGRKE